MGGGGCRSRNKKASIAYFFGVGYVAKKSVRQVPQHFQIFFHRRLMPKKKIVQATYTLVGYKPAVPKIYWKSTQKMYHKTPESLPKKPRLH